LGTRDFRSGTWISVSTDYYHGLLAPKDQIRVAVRREAWGFRGGGKAQCRSLEDCHPDTSRIVSGPVSA